MHMLISVDSNMQMSGKRTQQRRKQKIKPIQQQTKASVLCALMCWHCRSSPLAVIYSLITYIICCMVAPVLFIIFIGSKISIGRIIILACLFHNFTTASKSHCESQLMQTSESKKTNQSREWKQRSRRFMKRTRKPQQKTNF